PETGADLGGVRDDIDGSGSRSDRALIYLLGMRGSPALGVLAADTNQARCTRDAASWWIANGSAIHL
ncbi:MAG: hypothetical protein ACRDTS_23735, partial [Mycobacterium sp.]